MDTQGRNKYIWTNVNLNNLYIPKDGLFTLYEKDKTLYFDFMKDENIYILKSQDQASSWTKEAPIKSTNISRVKLIMNKTLNPNLKINHLLIDLKNISNHLVFKDLYFNGEKDHGKIIIKNNQPTQADEDDLEEIIEDLFVNSISDPKQVDFTHIKAEQSIETIEFEINKLKSIIQEIQNKQDELLELLEDKTNQENPYEKEIIKMQEKIKELKIPLIRKIFG